MSLQTEKSSDKTVGLSSRRKGLLLDRDGVINLDRNYVGTRDRFDFLPGLFPFLRAAQDRGWVLAVLTNQSGVGRGKYTVSQHDALMQWMQGELAREGVAIVLMLASFTHPLEAAPAYRRDSFWRKPNPGMVLEATQRLHLDPQRSALLGDKVTDMQAGLAGGLDLNLWLGGDATQASKGVTPVADYTAALRLL